ncbi:tRNA-dihydrouridine synthase family protein [Aestuariirhabdus sp. Z084]|uniref:tRNA dihydrouridine synthase n=1 Tax=Aestuariirhabdus haliotis TaxID=2918751 RepID=UPI00201B42E6|nr:tRNA-dihydrouridine synthase family protein [Aestuariirhabdus haliotis]MCL6416537.1 tRNA-dihydrouridine synthase family protein [Aestuariirhabdus haliotis]MCL6420527.1 tRNA-dihydrouridine synthase family protein [Aestuariirhabdus haliotis]
MLLLAPMEGIADHSMRALLTEHGEFDLCISEFVRVSNTLLPQRVFKRYLPELENGCQTASGCPVHVQLLGSDPLLMGENAHKVVEMGAPGIDLNFGCPAKMVNRHGGGALLLNEPEQVARIVSAVRRAVPDAIPVSAKMRLGYADTSLTLENACAIESSGASALTVHARTKSQGYRPPAHWEWIARIGEVVKLPLIANGEIWTYSDYLKCVEASGCEHVMLGRGALRNPLLSRQIKAQQADPNPEQAWQQIHPLLLDFYRVTEPHYPEKHLCQRVKQWLGFLAPGYQQAQDLFERIKPLKQATQIQQLLQSNA